jgi:Domain of unknown function (DUF6457)
VLDEWLEKLCKELDVPPDAVDSELLLDVARDVAHGVERRAAPLTTFVLGLAAGRAGGSREAIDSTTEKVQALIRASNPG